MAIQILPGGSRTSAMGSSIGTGLGQGLQLLLQDKMDRLLQQKQQSQTASGLQALGIPAQEASQISLLPKELQSHVIKNYLAGAESAGLNEALSALGGQQQQQPTSMLDGLVSQQTEAQPTQQAQQPMQQAQPEQQQVKPEQKRPSFQEILKNPRLKPEHRLQIEKMQRQERLDEKKLAASEKKEKLVEQREIDKENKNIIKDTNEGVKNAYANDRRLGRMEELVKKGDLTRPRWYSALKTLSDGIFGLGIDLHSLETADSQEFTKLSNEFVKEAKEMFGARITDADLRVFLKMVPTLSMTKDGKARVIHNMKLYNEGNRIKGNAMNQLIKENAGRSPRNLDSLIEERAKPELDELAERFKKGLQTDILEKKESGILGDITNPLDILLGEG